MKHVMSTVAVCLLLGPIPLLAAAQNQENQPSTPPGVQSTESFSGKATVQKIDYKNRTVTLKGENGRTFTVQVGEEARNFNQIKKGDLVNFHYQESMALAIHKSNEPPSATEREVLHRAAPGEMPSGTRIRTTQITATVENIDRDKREVKLLLPDGEHRTVKVGQDVAAFDRLQPGEQVVTTYTESFGIDVTRPGK